MKTNLSRHFAVATALAVVWSAPTIAKAAEAAAGQPGAANSNAQSNTGGGSAKAAQPSPAAAASGTKVEEIVITAQRREQNLQDVPIAVTALTGNALALRGLTSTESLSAAVPGLSFTRTGASGTPFIRGIGSQAGDPSSEQSVATYIDGVYIASPNVNIFDLDSVDHIEVLKGPQGTLFGRNATGGVIQIQTRDPGKDPTAEFTAGYGNYQTWTGSAYASAPLTDALRFNVAAQFRDQGEGWGRNVTKNVDTYKHNDRSVRAKLVFEPTPDTKVLLAADYSWLRSTGTNYRLPNGIIARDGSVFNLPPFDSEGGIAVPERTDTNNRGVSLTITHDFGPFGIRSISAYRKATGENDVDVDAVPGNYLNAYLHLYQRNYSQEIHFTSRPSSPVTWLVGAYYYDSRAGYSPVYLDGIDVGGVTLAITGLIHTKSASAFAQFTAPIFADTNLTAGIRYTDERQSFYSRTDLVTPPVNLAEGSAKQSFKKPTWRVSLDHKFTNDVMMYISYNRGIKSGGFSPLGSPATASFKPERLDAYEVGLKSELFDKMLRLNGSAFWYDYKNIQVQVVNGAATFTQNAASARIKGFDFDAELKPVDHLTITGGLAYTDGKYLSYLNASSYTPAGVPLVVNASGNRTVKTPKISGTASATYVVPIADGSVAATATVIHSGKFYWAADNRPFQPAYTLLNASLRWNAPGNRYSVTVWGRNLFDKHYLSIQSESSYGDLLLDAEPRTFGVTLGAKF